MNYNVDFSAFVRQMVPPMLRGETLMSLVRIMIIPVKYLWTRFAQHRATTLDKLMTTSTVQGIKKALAYAVGVSSKQFTIYEPDESTPIETYLYHASESQTATYLYESSEGVTEVILYMDGEVSREDDFRVGIPDTLVQHIPPVGAVEKVNYRKIIDVINTYKPAGRSYRVYVKKTYGPKPPVEEV